MSTNHLVGSSAPPEKVSANVGGTGFCQFCMIGWSGFAPVRPRRQTTEPRRTQRNIFMVWIVYSRRRDGFREAIKQNVPDSIESWDARRTSPPPKDCSRASYPQGIGAGMARMGYWSLRFSCSFRFFGNLGGGYFNEINFLCNVIALHSYGRRKAARRGFPRHGAIIARDNGPVS